MESELFTCEKYNCTLTRQACADRQAARRLHGKFSVPIYPGCQDCAQAAIETKNIEANHTLPRPWGLSNRIIDQKKQEGFMSRIKKIDNEKLKRMLADGKFTNEIAAEFGAHPGAVRAKIKRLGLTPNHSRRHKTAAPETAPVRQPRSLPSPALGEGLGGGVMPAQVIPVTLRLTVEVNVRVSAGAI